MDNFLINKQVNPQGLKKDEYDVAIIGAGIGGLVCGCYLAKAGLKVLIVEKHNKVGGYVTSFPRGEFIFEAAAIEDLGEGSNFRKIINSLDIDKKVDILKADINLTVFTPDYRINIYSNIRNTIEELAKFFPRQKRKMEEFFSFIDSYNIPVLYLRYRKKTFNELLNEYFQDKKIKSIFQILSSQIGLPPDKASALSVVTYFKTFIINGGYYPSGGLQTFSNAFKSRFKELGGNLILSRPAKKIIIKNNIVQGIIVNDKYIPSKFVVSNADATATFLDLIGEKYLKKEFILHVKNAIPSVSTFIVYIGLNKISERQAGSALELWDIPTYDIDNPFEENRLEKGFLKTYLYCYLSGIKNHPLKNQSRKSIALAVFAPYLTEKYWQGKRNDFMNILIERIEKKIPDIKNHIIKKENAIPQTLHRYTGNRNGAFKGWAPYTSQVDMSFMPMKAPIKNLYLAGHWVSTGVGESGVPQAAYTGEKVANLIIKGNKK